jgi:hypothetical protein
LTPLWHQPAKTIVYRNATFPALVSHSGEVAMN